MQDLESVQEVERVQEGRNVNVYSEVGPCAARSERVQRDRSVCSEVGTCAVRSERVQRGRSMCMVLWTVCKTLTVSSEYLS